MVLNEVEKQLVLEKLEGQLPDLIAKAEHSELWGYDLNKVDAVIKERFLNKFLVANGHKLEESKTQLLNTLQWRKEFCPLSAAFNEEHKRALSDTAFVTTNEVEKDDKKKTKVTTWNLYGAVKDRHELFGDLEGFLRWRIGLMEQGVALLDFTDPETSYMTQIHDYDNVSFLRLDAETKAATRKTIQTFQNYYPELLDYKYFVNVPKIMSWMFYLLKPLISKETADKFVVIDNAAKLDTKLGDWVPSDKYGGKGEPLSQQSAKVNISPVNKALVDQQVQQREDIDAATIVEQEETEVTSSSASSPPSKQQEVEVTSNEPTKTAPATETV